MTSDRNFETRQADAESGAAGVKKPTLKDQVMAAGTYDERLSLVGNDPRVLEACISATWKNRTRRV